VPVRLARTPSLLCGRSRSGGRAFAALLVLLGCASLQTAVADDTRTLSFQHTHRDDSITVTFKRNGRYDEDGLKKLNHFLRDWRNHEETRMDPQLFDILWEVHREVGAKEPIHIISSYRSPATNSMLRRRSRGVAKFSQHMLGKAIDFSIPGVSLEQVRIAGLRLQRGGVGYYPSSNFVHVDVGSIRHWPRMTHDQLARAFPDGKTVHVPSNGTPLKGYAAALAQVQRRGNAPSATSLGAARSAGIETADAEGARPKGGRSFLAKVLGIGSDEEEDTEAAAPRGRRPVAASPAAQEVAAVPMPRARPARAEEFALASASAARPARTEEFSLASATTARPARTGEFSLAAASTSPAPTPADMVVSRGNWQSSATETELQPDHESARAALMRAVEANRASALADLRSGERLAWITGPQGRPVPPRPPGDIESPPDTTASVATWATDPGRNDRVPTELALAYAASHARPVAARPATAAPMGSLRPANPASSDNATVATKKPALNPPAVKIAQRNFDPWLRGVVMTPSVHHSLSVAVVGATDPRSLRPLMHKPRTAAAMVFSNDPLLGLTSVRFSGPAVTFLPTIEFTTRTARLN
jgi:uncharacterized protein YcbK (DUF882 family)